MRVPTPKTDLWISFISVALLGASRVVGDDPTHHLEVWAFWGGIVGLGLLAVWHVLAFVLNLVRRIPANSSASVDNRGGAYIGGDNSGTQQVFHGPVMVNQTAVAPIFPGYPGRDFLPISLTIERLTANFHGRTILQAQALLKPYIGKWMRVTGQVRSVSQRYGGSFHVLLAVGPNRDFPFMVSCDFAKSWETRMHALAIQDGLTVIGKLEYVAAADLSLENCEIED